MNRWTFRIALVCLTLCGACGALAVYRLATYRMLEHSTTLRVESVSLDGFTNVVCYNAAIELDGAKISPLIRPIIQTELLVDSQSLPWSSTYARSIDLSRIDGDCDVVENYLPSFCTMQTGRDRISIDTTVRGRIMGFPDDKLEPGHYCALINCELVPDNKGMVGVVDNYLRCTLRISNKVFFTVANDGTVQKWK